jgi:ABC-type branched-subunit amino acid transport system substrate-binding protein
VFDLALSAVEERIFMENQLAMESGHAVTVALLEPFPAAGTGGVLTPDRVREYLEGAYTAQWRANHTASFRDHPRIRLMLANEGSHEDGWQVTTQQLVGMVNDEAPLVAVAGLGVNIAQTISGAQELSTHSLPMVGAAITADQIDYSRIPGFVRVTPSNEQFVTSLRHYLDRRPDLNSTLIVYDNNADSSTDLYLQSLRDDLEKITEWPRTKVADPMNFTGISAQPNSSPAKFVNITATICATRPALVLYAGHKDDLVSFIHSLKDRVCRDHPSQWQQLGQRSASSTIRRPWMK